MGLLDRFRGTPDDGPWQAPPRGLCQCADHLDTLTDLVIAATPPVPMSELAAPEALTVSESEERYLHSTQTGQRRGPFEWRLAYSARVARLYDEGAPASIDDMFFIQPGVERLLRIDDTTLAVGAPSLCADGLHAAFLTALSNPRVRRLE